MTVRAGELRKRVEIESVALAQSTYGSATETWSKAFDAWASIEPTTGREFPAADTVHAEVTHKITIRWQTGIDSEMRVKYGSRYFDILAVLNEKERDEKIILLCKEVLS